MSKSTSSTSEGSAPLRSAVSCSHSHSHSPAPRRLDLGGGAGRRIVLLALALCLTTASLAAGQLARIDGEKFPVPDPLATNVDFWTRIYTDCTRSEALLHDDRHLQVVYARLDFTELLESDLSAAQKQRVKRQERDRARSKYRSILQDLAAGRESKSYAREQARIAQLFADVPGNRGKYSGAMDRLRFQTCLADQFADAVERSGLFLPAIEEIFERRRLPQELTRLPFVESMFQLGARSSARAGGIWQFMPDTGRLYLQIRAEFDERYDPLRATDAAARLLADNYKSLRTWPLALTAYNHGKYGMQRAVRTLGTRDLGVIAEKYRGRTFGFASRNFYAEFVAAVQVYLNRAHYFPDATPKPPLSFAAFAADRWVSVHQLTRSVAADFDELKLLNPGLSPQIWSGDLHLPPDYDLRVPKASLAAFQTAYSALSDEHKTDRQVGFHHMVRAGDTLATIARKYGTSVRTLQSANSLANPNRIRIGQVLLIPPSGSGAGRRASRTPAVVAEAQPSRTTPRSAPPTAPTMPSAHVVRRGETLDAIAQRYGTTVETLVTVNGLRSANRIYVGQRLTLAAPGAAKRHVVRTGETLTSIARRYGTTVQAIRRSNNLRNDVIHPRQVLTIP